MDASHAATEVRSSQNVRTRLPGNESFRVVEVLNVGSLELLGDAEREVPSELLDESDIVILERVAVVD
jgi:hypothetical protein